MGRFTLDLDYSAKLRLLMQAVDICSFRALSRKASVSLWQVDRLRKGQAAAMCVDALNPISVVLQLPLSQIVESFSAIKLYVPETKISSAQLQQEYERLQVQLEQQRDLLQQEFQQMCLRSLESWLIQFPTLVYAAQQNPQFPSKNFLPFIRPLEQLLQDWEIEAIAPVGTELAYDPQLHQLMEGKAQPGDRVKVRYTGYRQCEKLLYRAKVSRVVA